MFAIGDKIVYPMHGAGIIESIEEKEILGERKQYYVMKMPIGDMKVMIPIQRKLYRNPGDHKQERRRRGFRCFRKVGYANKAQTEQTCRENMNKIKMEMSLM